MSDQQLHTEYEALKEHAKRLEPLIQMALSDCKAFINQCDREGIGMATVTDHRKRVTKFLAELKKIGME